MGEGDDGGTPIHAEAGRHPSRFRIGRGRSTEIAAHPGKVVRRVIIDTNVLASFLTDRDPAQQEQAAALLEAAAERSIDLILHQIVVVELVYVLRNIYRASAHETSLTIKDLMAMPGVTIVDAMPWGRLFDFWPDPMPDLADGALAAVAHADKYDAIATFDLEFRRRLVRAGIGSYWRSRKD